MGQFQLPANLRPTVPHVVAALAEDSRPRRASDTRNLPRGVRVIRVNGLRVKRELTYKWLTRKSFSVGKLYRACYRLCRSRFLQSNIRWKVIAEIYTKHSVLQLSNLKSIVKFLKRWKGCACSFSELCSASRLECFGFFHSTLLEDRVTRGLFCWKKRNSSQKPLECFLDVVIFK